MTSFLNALNDPELVDDVPSREAAMRKAEEQRKRDAAAFTPKVRDEAYFEAARATLRESEARAAAERKRQLDASLVAEEDADLILMKAAAAAAVTTKSDDRAPAPAKDLDYDSDPADAFTLPADKLVGTVAYIGAATAALARTTWRGLAYGEMISEDSSSDEDAKYVSHKPERFARPIGSENGTRSSYVLRWGAKNHFAATAGWWMREAHHDPLGADPMMLSMLCVAFIAGMFYTSFLEALLFCLVIEAFEWLTWLVVRGASKVIAAELDMCESRGVAMVYNILAFIVGVSLAKYVLYTWGAVYGVARLRSFWDANARDVGCPASNNGVYLVWAPCTDTVSFVVLAMLFLCVVFASFRRLFVPSMIVLALMVPATAVMATNRPHFFYTLFATVASVFYFMFFAIAPIKQTYMWNAAISIAFYLFAYSLLVLSRSDL